MLTLDWISYLQNSLATRSIWQSRCILRISPKKIRAELSSKVSALELRSAGLTPQNVHTELPSSGCPQRKPSTECCSADGVSWALVIHSGDLLNNPVSLGDGEWTWTGLRPRGCTLYVAGIPGLQVFLEYMAIDALKFASAPGPFGDRGGTPRWWLMAGTAACCTRYVYLHSHSQRHLSPGHKAGLLTVLLTSTGCVFQVATGDEKSATL